MSVFVKKANGTDEAFDKEKVIRTCIRMGATREVAEIIYHENPSRSQLDWYIAEKQLLLEELHKLIDKNRS